LQSPADNFGFGSIKTRLRRNHTKFGERSRSAEGLTFCHERELSAVTHRIFLPDYFVTIGVPPLKVLGDSKVTEKFQATIPRIVRDLLGLNSGDRLVFVSAHGNVLVKKGKVRIEN